MTTGTVTRVMSDRGFAFLSADDVGDVFLHCRDLDPAIEFCERLRGMVLQFDVQDGPKGKRAVNARAVD